MRPSAAGTSGVRIAAPAILRRAAAISSAVRGSVSGAAADIPSPGRKRPRYSAPLPAATRHPRAPPPAFRLVISTIFVTSRIVGSAIVAVGIGGAGPAPQLSII